MDTNILVKLTARAWALDILAALNRDVPGRQAALRRRAAAGRRARARGGGGGGGGDGGSRILCISCAGPSNGGMLQITNPQQFTSVFTTLTHIIHM